MVSALGELLDTELRFQYPEPPKTGKVRVKVKVYLGVPWSAHHHQVGLYSGQWPECTVVLYGRV